MDLDLIIQQLARQAEAIRALAAGVSDEQARWRPDPDSWSILEVVNHVYDEEREDFRAHLDAILNGNTWTFIDPQGWVTERSYNRRRLEESLQNFVDERQKSLAWLRELRSPDWEAAFQASFGPLRAGDVLVSWAAHDLLHLRQLVELDYTYTLLKSTPFSVQYAGEW
jgi:hypothetical protein